MPMEHPEPSPSMMKALFDHLNHAELFYAVVGDMALRMRGLEVKPGMVEVLVNVTRNDREALVRHAKGMLLEKAGLREGVPFVLRKTRGELDMITVGRRTAVDFQYSWVYVASPEDIIIREMVKDTKAGTRNAVNIQRLSANFMDLAYLIQMTRKLGLYKRYIGVKKQAEGI
jgi:hypothetical protein